MTPPSYRPATRVDVKVERLEVLAYEIPTTAPESDGTLAWTKTTLVVVHALGGGARGLGYTYADRATAEAIREHLEEVVVGRDAMHVQSVRDAMVHAIRNVGRAGVLAMAISAVDVALWDLKARVLGMPLVTLLGERRSEVPLYGSGGFTSLSVEALVEQLGDFAVAGMRHVKMKVGRAPDQDRERVSVARRALGAEVDLFVDANGAYARKEALSFAEAFAALGVRWFEEPVSSDDLEGLRLLRDRAPFGLEIAAGEYGYHSLYFRRMLEAGAVDVLQADASRCGGITGFLEAATLCDAHGVPLSAHCAPALHLHACAAAPRLRHLEYFHDHVRIEGRFFDGAIAPVNGALRPDLSRPGHGLEFKAKDAQRHAV